ncbi:MAG: hypothetical protein EXS59_00260 [Candidatus Taylorbacteria bacterium]|nr:hypothetical protein [Candidatus Taylorbacteria bacterium]
MLYKYVQKNLTWIDLECPTRDEVHQIINDWNVNPIVAQELVGPTLRSKVEVYPDFIYLVLHFPIMRRRGSKHQDTQQEVDFIIGRNFIITSRYDNLDSIHEFSKLFEVNSILDKSNMSEHGGMLFFYMIRSIYDSLLSEFEGLNDSIHKVEEKIFKGEERAMVVRISEISRDLLDAKRAMRLHREILESFDVASRRFFGEEFFHQAKAITGEFYKAHNALESNLDSIMELRETNNSMLNTKQNEIMKIFTILAFVTFPLSLAIEIVTIPSTSNPLFDHPQTFWIIITGTVLSCLIMFSFFKYKKWL